MENLDEAYQILDQIKEETDQEKILEGARQAFNKSELCVEAATILSKLNTHFSEKENILITCLSSLVNEIEKNKNIKIFDNLNKARFELGSLYYDYGMNKKALLLFNSLEKDDSALPIKYKLMIIYAILEDDIIDSYYNKHIKNANDIDYVRLSFTYMIYKYKKANFRDVRELLININAKNPMIIKILKDETNNEDSFEAKEAYKVFRNNSLLINSCPNILNYLKTIY